MTLLSISRTAEVPRVPWKAEMSLLVTKAPESNVSVRVEPRKKAVEYGCAVARDLSCGGMTERGVVGAFGVVAAPGK